MSEIDWSKAPEGATHYAPAIGSFRALWAKVEDGKFSFYDEVVDRWYWGAQPLRHEKFIPRPVAWTGAGLPPVGTVCEYRCGYVEEPFEYSQCKIIAHFEGESEQQLAAFTYVAHDGVIHVGRGLAKLFRPIRTQEQIEAEEREKAIEEMIKVDRGTLSRTVFCGMLYDAGYRKQGEAK